MDGGVCLICHRKEDSSGNGKLSKCKDVNSWRILYEAAERQNFEALLSPRYSKDVYPPNPVTYHRSCRSSFILNSVAGKEPTNASEPSLPRPVTRSSVGGDHVQGDILPKICIFCNKNKYKKGERTREKLHSLQELEADAKVRQSILKHIEKNTDQKKKAETLLLLLSKDLISSEAKYHESCKGPFVKILIDKNSTKNSTSTNSVIESTEAEQPCSSSSSQNVPGYNFRDRQEECIQTGNDGQVEQEESELDDTIEYDNEENLPRVADSDEDVIHPHCSEGETSEIHDLDKEQHEQIFQPIQDFCTNLFECPDVVEFKQIRKIVNEKAASLGITLNPSYQHNLLRKVKRAFPNLNFVHKDHNCVLVFPSSLEVSDLAVKYHNISTELSQFTRLKDEEKSVFNVAKLLHENIRRHASQISWPPKPAELKLDKVRKCIPKLLDLFCKTLFLGSATEKETKRSFLNRNSITQDLVYCVSKRRIKTPKSILFPSVVKGLCNNLEVNKLINLCGHGISSYLIREIETETALQAITQQLEHRVVIPDE